MEKYQGKNALVALAENTNVPKEEQGSWGCSCHRLFSRAQ